MDVQMVILAGGLATRLGELTKNKPKSLIEILGKPFLAYQLELLKNHGITNVVLCIGHFGSQIQQTFGNGSKYGMQIRYSLEETPLGTAGALKNAESLLHDKFFVMYGDSYVFLDFQKIYFWFLAQNKLGLDTVYLNHDSFDKSNTAIGGNMVTRYSKVDKTKDMVYIDYGVTLFKKEILNLVPANQKYALEDVFVDLIEKKQLLAWDVKERFYEIGSIQGLKDFETFAKQKLKS